MSRLSWVPVVAMIALVATAFPAEAQWKWRDKTGRIQYSDLAPPSEVAEKDILQRPSAAQRLVPVQKPAASSASAPALAAPKLVDPELEAKKRKAEQDEAAKKKQEEGKVAAARAESCARAKSHMRSIEDGIRLARTNEKGEREILDDKGREEEAKRTRALIASECSK
jgi:hypothetical protein